MNRIAGTGGLGAALTLALCTQPPGAAAATNEEILDHFSRLDDDCSLRITPQEAADWKPLSVNFSKVDRDGSNDIDVTEFAGLERVVEQMTRSEED